MNLRRRDIGAAIISIFLARVAWNSDDVGPDSLSASVTLAFYSELKSFASSETSQAEKKPSGGNAKGRIKTALPVPLDLDGDGTVEAIVIPSVVGDNKKTEDPSSPDTSISKWGLKVLDLKPLHDVTLDVVSYPFQPRTIFTAGIDGPTGELKPGQTKETNDDASGTPSVVVPVKMTTGQIHLAAWNFEKEEGKSEDTGSTHDRNRHFFCGTDWHHASNSCAVPCPGGRQDECPSGQTCYADTPCDSKRKANMYVDSEQFHLATTPGGTLPGVVTLWSDGSLTMHAVTKDLPVDATTQKVEDFADTLSKVNKDGWVRVAQGGLELRRLWKVSPFSTTAENNMGLLEFDEVDVVLATDSPIGSHGVVVVGGTYRIVKDAENANDSLPAMNSHEHESFHAIDALTGETLWSHGGGLKEAKKASKDNTMDDMMKESNHGKLVPPTMSTARRRSHIPTSSDNEELNTGGDSSDILSTKSCLHFFRASAMDPDSHTFPHISWGRSEDTQLVVTHFDRKHPAGVRNRGMKNGRGRPSRKKGRAGESQKKSWLKKAINSALPFSSALNDGGGFNKQSLNLGKKATLHYGKPNVVLFRHRGGILALSLRNGRSVCHLSLLEKSLYSDINGDGVLDQIQVITESSLMQMDTDTPEGSDFALDLARRVSDKEMDKTASEREADTNWNTSPLCHGMALSGLPPREEIFGVPLCGSAINSRRKYDRKKPGFSRHSPIHPAPPLLIEGSDGGNDVVFATSDGVITRYDPRGKLIWKNVGVSEGLPTWSGKTGHGRAPEYMGRIDFMTPASSLPSSIVAPHTRPIVVSGEDEMVILTSGRGSILGRASFPQSAISPPILTKLSSDGTTDVVIISADGMWGYKVTVHRQAGGFLRVVVGLIFAGIALAALYNRYSNPPGKDIRSTDE
mmetsp:Transcript_2476/g.3899  ORF Transcript_2476/g.3899 Transcript_2476/m.3899 type:complete len:912 (-) Transcript_2476:3688-6423(-)